MEGLETAACFMDDLLNFSSDVGENDDDDDRKTRLALPHPPPPSLSKLDRSFPEVAEEELEWLSNKDAFPEVETFVDIISGGFPGGNLLKQQSPVSVLDTRNAGTTGGAAFTSCCTGFQVPVKARSKRHRSRRRFTDNVPVAEWWWYQEKEKSIKLERPTLSKTTGGRKCLHCQSEKTPQWRAGPDGPKTLCNACGVRYKSGRLVPEYRPASSPTFSSEVHSNSHRKIIEMRKMKQIEMG